MAEVTSHLLTPWDFGRQLISTGDLDPVYIFLWEAYSAGDLPRSTLLRWLLSYLCFYHSGTASWITSQYLGHPTSSGVSWRLDTRYWDAMEVAAGSKEYPRAHERRHFRGDNAARSVAYLRARGIDSLFAPLLASGVYLSGGGTRSGVMRLGEVMEVVQGWVGFGPWIAFKAADMLERLSLTHVDFSGAERYFYSSPRKGAGLLRDIRSPTQRGEGISEEVVRVAVKAILGQLGCPTAHLGPLTQATVQPRPRVTSSPRLAGLNSRGVPYSSVASTSNRPYSREAAPPQGEGLLAPPRYERPVNIQEAETILCKWYSHNQGHYRIGEDIEAARRGLLRFARCRISQVLIGAGKRGGLW